MPRPLPIMLDLQGRKVVVVGGGVVGRRKAKAAVEAGAKVVAVAIAFIEDWPVEAERIERPYETGDLAGALLAFAATDDADVNARVTADARALGILVSRADASAEGNGDFILPARLELAGPTTITVSTGSAALSARLRDSIAQLLADHDALRMAAFLHAWRDRWTHGPMSEPRRRSLLRDLATTDALHALADHGEAGLLDWLRVRYPEIGSHD